MKKEDKDKDKDKDAVKSSLFLVPGLVMFELLEALNNKKVNHERIGELLGVTRVLAEKAIPKEKTEMVIDSFDSIDKVDKFIDSIKKA